MGTDFNAIPAGTKRNCAWLLEMFLTGKAVIIPAGYPFGTSTNMKVQRVILLWLVALLTPGQPGLKQAEMNLIQLLRYQVLTAFMTFNGTGGLPGTEQMSTSHAIHHQTPLGVALWFALERARSEVALWLVRWWVAYAALCVSGSTPDHGVVLAAPRSDAPIFGKFGSVRREERDDVYQVLMGFVPDSRYSGTRGDGTPRVSADTVGNVAVAKVQRNHPQVLRACRGLTRENAVEFWPTLIVPIRVRRFAQGHVSSTVDAVPRYGFGWATVAWAHYPSGTSGMGEPPMDLGAALGAPPAETVLMPTPAPAPVEPAPAPTPAAEPVTPDPWWRRLWHTITGR